MLLLKVSGQSKYSNNMHILTDSTWKLSEKLKLFEQPLRGYAGRKSKHMGFRFRFII